MGSELVKHGHGMTLVPALRSKAERGYGLAARDGWPPLAFAGGFAERPASRCRPRSHCGNRHPARPRAGCCDADALACDPASGMSPGRGSLRRMRSAIRSSDRTARTSPPGWQRTALARADARSGARLDIIVADVTGHPLVGPRRRQGPGAVAPRSAARQVRAIRQTVAADGCGLRPARAPERRWSMETSRVDEQLSARSRVPAGTGDRPALQGRARFSDLGQHSDTGFESTRSGCATPSICWPLRCPVAEPPTTSKRWPRFRTTWVN